MHQLFDEMLAVIDAAFRELEAVVPKPARVQQNHTYVFRFEKQGVREALIQKLALVQSVARAAQILLKHGHTMEQGMLHRVMDEANEDVLFLALAMVKGDITPLHQRYLAAFWAEEFSDLGSPERSHQSREMVPRKKIRAYLAGILPGIPGEAHQAPKIVSKAYSGFIHGASPHIMECFGGPERRFNTSGLFGSPRIPEYTYDLWNYMYRVLGSHEFVASALRMEPLADSLRQQKKKFESLVGKNC